jgi:hypothetical protein
VASNLLSNAIKFTPKGGRVQIFVERRESSVDLTVADTGQGISPEFLPHVFERFRQADGALSRKSSGLGLGLAIVRHIVELHGGTVVASSEGTGRGATFTVRLPLSVAARRSQAADVLTASRHVRRRSKACASWWSTTSRTLARCSPPYWKPASPRCAPPLPATRPSTWSRPGART